MSGFDLTDDEALLLDGKCSPKAQALVDAAKLRVAARSQFAHLSAVDAGFIADVVSHAAAEKKLVYQTRAIDKCKLCGAGGEYARHARTTRSHRRGQINYDRPIRIGGIELRERFVIVTGYVSLGACSACMERLKPDLRAALADLNVEMPDALAGERRWKRWPVVECSKCKWRGHEGEMGKLRTLMGDGWYPGQCPKCPAQNMPFSQAIKSVDPAEYAIVEVTPARQEAP